jgi:sensor histidine kinase YesM
MAFIAMLNGLFREHYLAQHLGNQATLIVSGISLSMLVVIITYICFPLIAGHTGHVYRAIGLQWVIMTLMFEFLLGYYVMGRNLTEILQVFNLARGDLFLLVLISSLVSPYLVARIKGAIP